MAFRSLPFIRTLLLVALARSAIAGSYTLNQNNVGSTFLSNFQWESIADPTNGRVQYLDQQTALSENLTFTSDDTFIMRADYKTTLNATGSGRKSNRIKSNAQYNTHVAVFDIRHMPQGCGTWPALWEADDTVGTSAGEIDILEGVNDVEPDSVTLHTTGTCTMPSARDQLGSSLSNDCSSSNDIENGNDGCSVNAPYTSSYGPTFNNYGGGYYAVERTAEYIRVWFWSRNDTSIPSDISSGATTVITDNWGTPIADFPDTSCKLGSVFKDNNIIVDLTFCGNWAGEAFNPAGCPGNCTEYVNNNPAAFENAYWDFAAARIYLPSPSSESSAASANLATSTSDSSSLFSQGFFARLISAPVSVVLLILGGGWFLA